MEAKAIAVMIEIDGKIYHRGLDESQGQIILQMLSKDGTLLIDPNSELSGLERVQQYSTN